MGEKLIHSHLVAKHTDDAIKAILRYSEKKQKEEEETSILGATEERISLSITKKRLQKPKTIDPRVIPLAHPIIDPRKTQICLIVKDPQREYKDLLDKLNIKFIGRVVGIAKLKGKWKGFEERRQLLKENGLFLVDDRVSAMMPTLLGKMWFKAKKQPLPVNMGAKDLKSHLERAINNTFMNENAGQTVTVKIGTTSHTHKQILDNITSALPKIISHIDEGWDNIQNVYLSLPGVSLPLWSCDLGSGKGGRWEGMTAEEPEAWGGFDGSADDDDEEDEPSSSLVLVEKGKKRSVAADEEEVKPKKKKSKASPLTKEVEVGAVPASPPKPGKKFTKAEKAKAETVIEPSKEKKRKGKAVEPEPPVVEESTSVISRDALKKKRMDSGGPAAAMEKKKLKAVESGGKRKDSAKSKLVKKGSR